MTPQEIINEIQKLPPIQQKEVVESVSNIFQEKVISEAEVARQLFANRIIREIPEGWNEADEEFDPIEIDGKPLSETIIEDRR